MRIYTKSGDNGTTSLFGGKRVDKNSGRIEAYGTVDELNSLIGVIISGFTKVEPSIKVQPLTEKLLRVQEELFILGADLSAPIDLKVKVPRITKRHVSRLEQEIDSWDKNLPKLRSFILPGGSKAGAKLHFARTVARRAERAIADLAGQEKISKNVLPYINRLSDWLFVLARFVNRIEGHSERLWKGRGGH
ncbi:cob(I)yrinic acid a,c-diamide adenosyltransferase [Candidatus Curtissbacteria bacterium]|nr:cob(I)yrinic acid a,c-diamide adenosyltransferase [Candidatus Curtissbacteria bacterium]